MKYCSSTLRTLLLAFILLLHIISVQAQNTSSSVHHIWPVAVPQLPPGEGSVVLIVASVQQCVGCAALTINQCITQVHTLQPDVACVVSILTDDVRDVETVRSRFITPYVLAFPLEKLSLSTSESESYPAVFVIERNGGVVFAHYDLQHTAMNTDVLQKALSGRQNELYTIDSLSAPADMEKPITRRVVHEPEREVLLQEPDDRSVVHLVSVVLQPETRILYGINTLTNNIERWEADSGELLSPLVLPDTVRYFFRLSSDDALWSLLQQQGYDVMEITALAMVKDTLYALATLISGYSLHTVVEHNGGHTDTLQELNWSKGQVVVKITDGLVRSILPLPSHYSFLDLTANTTTVSGTCIDATKTISEYAAGDSIVFLATIDAFSVVQQNTEARHVTVWKQKNSSETSIGQLCSDAHGMLWYCDPQQNMLIAQRADGVMQFIEPQGALRRCGSSILIGAKDSRQSRMPAQPYILQEMVAESEAVLLLVPTGSSSLPCTVQSYSATTGFLGEQKLDSGLLGDVQALQLAGIEGATILMLVRTDDKHWKLLRVPVPGANATPVSQENFTR